MASHGPRAHDPANDIGPGSALATHQQLAVPIRRPGYLPVAPLAAGRRSVTTDPVPASTTAAEHRSEPPGRWPA